MDEKTYELKRSFQYSHKGEMHDASFVTLSSPNYKHMDKIVPIKQAVTAAIAQIQERDIGDGNDDQADGDVITGAQILQLLYVWDGNLMSVFMNAQELFKSGVALVDGEAKLTVPLMEKMDPADFERLTGDYIAAFLAPSLMGGE